MGIMHYAIIKHFRRQREMGRTGRARRNGRGNVRDGVSKASRAANLTSKATGQAGKATEQLTGRAGRPEGRVSRRGKKLFADR